MTLIFNTPLSNSSSGDGKGSQVETMPTPSQAYEGEIVQYVGETTSEYVNGYFYKCIANEDYIPANVTVSQTAGLSMGSFTVDADKFIAKVNNIAGTYRYEFKGYPSVIYVTDNSTSTTLSFNRYSTIDGSGYYGWVTNDNIVVFTTTKTPTSNSTFYTVGSGTEPVEADYTYISTTTRDTSRMLNGYWAVKDTEPEIVNFQEEYGIGNDQSAFIGVQISVTYTLASGNAYNWTRINVQPNGGGTGGIEYTDLHATSPITYNSTNGTYGILTATNSNLGVVKPDGTTITVDANGVISSSGGSSDIKVYTFSGLSITTSNVTTKSIVQAVHSANLPEGSIVTGEVNITDSPANNTNNALMQIIRYLYTDVTTAVTSPAYRLILTSINTEPYCWESEYLSEHPDAQISWYSAPLAFYNMPTASQTYNGRVAQYVGVGDGVHEQGLYYICEEQAGSYSWNHLQVEQIATTSDFGIVKIKTNSGGSEPLQITDGVLSANKATGNYSLSVAGNGSTTNSSTNMGANSTAHGWYAMAIGCDSVVGDSTNDVRVVGAIQLGRGTNTTAGSFSVGLSTNGTTWNNYQLLNSAGLIPVERLRTTVADTTSTTATISNVEAGKDYTFSQALTSLTITANDTSFNESTITFTSGSTITVTLPASLSQLGSTVTFEPNTTYVLSIWNNKLLVGVQS